MPQAAAASVARVLKSAAANAENNHNSGGRARRGRRDRERGSDHQALPAARPGRAFPIHKPMTHITIVVADREA
jgi:ribosomal protein L22